ncbi:MAG TPA: mannosyltransferase family protein [Anaeromyxobacteraceae bacterium]|nr:mannosyltransferase family protein [Anaeromyxobacteraceae bacterium]
MSEARRSEESAPSGPSFLRDVLAPFLLFRALLAAVAWFGAQVSPSWSYPFPDAVRRGFAFLPQAVLDAFGRWDSHWYLDVAGGGYALRGPLGEVQSNVAFFPVYPWLVRVAALPLRPALGATGSLYPAALLVSNACALGALAVLLRLAARVTGSAEAAGRAALYLLAFPTGFVLSSAYPESLFLLLATASVLAADRGRFARAGALGFLAALSRPGGVIVAVAIAWMALEPPSAGERPSLRRAAFALLPPAGLALHAANLWRLTGDPLALFRAQAAWGRSLASPWRTVLAPRDFHPFLGPLEAAVVLASAALALWLVRRRRTRALGVYGLASLAPVALSGTLVSSARFALVLFPSFVALGELGRRPVVDRALLVGFCFGQAVLFLFWTRFFWVG